MSSHLLARSVLSVLAAWSVGATVAPEAHQGAVTATLSDRSLRQMAINQPVPTYPQTSVRKKLSGVVVVSISVNMDGQTDSVDILEAPDLDISRSVQDTLKQWTFRPLTSAPGATDRKRMAGKLIFYFRLDGGVARVLSAEDAIGGGARQSVPGMVAIAPGVAGPSGTAVQIHLDQLAPLLAKGRSAVIDVRERTLFALKHRDGSLNIPIDELTTRVKTELLGVPRVVVDCTEDALSQCQIAAAVIARQGVPEVVILIR